MQVLKDEKLRRHIGQTARETVRKRFLLIRYLEERLDPFNSFETIYRYKG